MVFNLKISGIIAGAAFILSFLIGLAGRTSMPMLFVRPLLFAVLFFIISGFANILVSRFLPELLEEDIPDRDKTQAPGSRINITDEDYTGLTPPNSAPSQGPDFIGAQADDSEEGLGNISDLLKRRVLPQASAGSPPEDAPPGLDQNAQDSYTKNGGMEAFPRAGSSPGANAAGSPPAGPLEISPENASDIPAGNPDSVDRLPDLDSMAGAFLPASADEESETIEYSVSTPSPKSQAKSKTPAWAGDFNAKDMAAGLRTILSKEKEG